MKNRLSVSKPTPSSVLQTEGCRRCLGREGATSGGQGELGGTQDLGRTNYSEGVRPTAHVHHQGVDGGTIPQSHQEAQVLSNLTWQNQGYNPPTSLPGVI